MCQLTILISTLNNTYFISIVINKHAVQKTLMIRSEVNVQVINTVSCNNFTLEFYGEVFALPNFGHMVSNY
jgi:hypothetical protein